MNDNDNRSSIFDLAQQQKEINGKQEKIEEIGEDSINEFVSQPTWL